MAMHTSTSNKEISLARELQKNLSYPTRAHGLLYHVKVRKRSSKHKWIDREYHVQESKYMSQISVKMSYATTQLPEL